MTQRLIQVFPKQPLKKGCDGVKVVELFTRDLLENKLSLGAFNIKCLNTSFMVFQGHPRGKIHHYNINS